MSAAGSSSARDVLWYLVFWGYAVNTMVRTNIPLAIVAMVKSTSYDVTIQTSECFDHNTSINWNSSLDKTSDMGAEDGHMRFPWDEYQQSMVLGSFFWLHWVTQVPGGMLAQRFGAKRVFGFSNFAMCLVGLLTPLAARLDYRVLVTLRVVQGLIGGVSSPSILHMAASWIPPNERSKFVSAYLGTSIGAGITMTLSGFLVDYCDWPAVFYATAVLGTIWFIAWWSLVFDSPSQHPRIDPAEREYIEASLGTSRTLKKPATPWRSILTSVPVWLNCLSLCGAMWGVYMILIQAPTYLKNIHGWDIRMTGLLSGVPHFCRVVFALSYAIFSDRLLTSKAVTRSTMRKLATLVCTVGQGLLFFALAWCGCNWLTAFLCVTIVTMFGGVASTGPYAIFVDLSPNFAGITAGIGNMVSLIPGFLSPIMIGALTYHNQTIGQWRIVFLISTGIVALPGLLYVFCGSTRQQPWNSPQNKELEALRTPEPNTVLNGNHTKNTRDEDNDGKMAE